MSVYCIGDLHGRYDLFLMALEEINFDIEKDKIYILGDVIDVNYGAIKIIKYIMQYPNSFELILGNHEKNFKSMETSYDIFMLDAKIKQKIQDIVDNYMSSDKITNKLYEIIGENEEEIFEGRDISIIKENAEVNEWLKPSNKRILLLESILSLIEYLDYNKIKFFDIKKVLSDMNGIFNTKEFVRELLELDNEEYLSLKKYIFSRTEEIKFTYFDKDFWLMHTMPFPNLGAFLIHIPNMTTKNQYVIYGHEPVPKIHNKLIGKYFDFNYREVFSYIDRFNNHYYNLDMGDNTSSILRLDDFEEFYVIKYKKEPKQNSVKPPTEPVSERKVGYKMVDSEFKVNKRPKGFSFITYKDHCIEFLIGVNKLKKEIYYIRISYMHIDIYKHQILIEVISDWYENQSIECIIEKVIADYNSKKDTEDFIQMEQYIRGYHWHKYLKI